MKVEKAHAANRDAKSGAFLALLKILLSLALLWLFALAIARGLLGAPANTVAIAPLGPIQRKIEWRPVKDSHGYLLQLRDQRARLILERKLKTSRTTVELPPGRYSLRVASLNKFGKPASWSAWATLHLRRPTAAVQNDSDPLPNESEQPADSETGVGSAADPDREKASAPGSGPDWRILVPGWSQYARGQTWRGLAWMAGFAGLGAAGYGFWQTGNSLALSAEATTPLLLLAPLSGNLNASLFLLQDRANARAAYDAAQADQRTVGLIAGVLYLLQIADALWLSPSASAAEPAVGETPGRITTLPFGDINLSAELRAPLLDHYPAPTRAQGAKIDASTTGSFAARDEGIQLRFTKRF